MSEIVNLTSCPRCRGTHRGVPARRLSRPVLDDWEWWATCPTLGEPVLLTAPARRGDGVIERAMEIFVNEFVRRADDEVWAGLLREAESFEAESFEAESFEMGRQRGYW